MSPYRTRASTAVDTEDSAPSTRIPIVELSVLLLSAFRVIVALVTREECGAEVGLATAFGLLSAHFLLFAHRRRARRAPER